MTSAVSNDIVSNANNSTIAKNSQSNNTATTTSSSSSSSVSSEAFLNLLCMQLQYQDPTNPMDNNEMLAQEAQFVTLEQMEKLASSFSEFSSIYQANSLIGQKVEVSSNTGNSVVGTVEYVDYSDSEGASISVNGTLYPLDNVSKVYPKETSTSNDDSSNETNEEDKNFIKEALSYVAYNIGNISQKLSSYIGGDNSSAGNGENNASDTTTTGQES